MKDYLVKMFGVSLVITMVVEVLVAFLFWTVEKSRNVYSKHRKSAMGGRKGSGRAGTGGSEDGQKPDVGKRTDGAGKGEKRSIGRGEGQRYGGMACGRLRNRLLLVLLVNLLTNPLAVLFCWLGRIYLPLFLAFPFQVLVEIAVVAAEGCVYRSFAKKPGWQMAWPVVLAVVANVCSWSLGLVANRYLWMLDYLEMAIRQALYR